MTAADGTFALTGQFSGAITLQFSNAASGAALGPLPLEIPAGSVTVLENIEIRHRGAGARPHPAARGAPVRHRRPHRPR